MDVTAEVGTSAINKQQAMNSPPASSRTCIHANRMLSLSLATLGIIVNQVDRFLSNAGVNVWRLFELWMPYVLAQVPRPLSPCSVHMRL